MLPALARLLSVVRRVGGSLAHNVPLALLSLALATLLWVAVTNAENPSLRRPLPFDVPLHAINIPAAMTVTGFRPNKVHVTLIGPQDTINSVQAGDLTAKVDLSSANSSGQVPASGLDVTADVHVSVRQQGLQAEVEPATVDVTLEATARRTVPVRVNKIDVPPVGWELNGDPSPQPAQATITGSKQQVDAVAAVVADVKLTGLTVSGNQLLTLDPEDSSGNSIGGIRVDPPTATVTVKVRQVLFQHQVLVDPRISGHLAPGYSIAAIKVDPQTVNVVGPLEVVNQIPTAPTQQVDVEGATTAVIRTVPLQLPSGATVSGSQSTVVVTVSIQPQQHVQGSLLVVPKVIGVAAGLVAIPQAAALTVNLSGAGPTIVNLTAADVTATLDATGLGAGVHQIEPKITLPAGVQLDSMSPDHVGVVLAPANLPR